MNIFEADQILPPINCASNFVMQKAINADQLQSFYHELAHHISMVADTKLYLVDDIFARHIMYAAFDPSKITRVLEAIIDLDCCIVISCFGQKDVYSNSKNISLDQIEIASIKSIRAYKRFYGPQNYLVHGSRFSLQIDFWREKENVFHANHFNYLASILAVSLFDQSFIDIEINGRLVPAFKQFAELRERTLSSDPIDVIYTWVDSDDEAWVARRNSALEFVGDNVIQENGLDKSRFQNNDELLYSLRSMSYYMRGIRNIYIVTDLQIPSFLNINHPKINIVDHREIFNEPEKLPSFNSNAIGSQLHHLDSLAEKYLYFNDDIMIGRSLTRETFFDEYNRSKCYYSSFVSIPPSAIDGAYTVVDQAALNNRKILEKKFGLPVYRKFKHTPIPTLKSCMYALESQFPDAFKTTVSNQFRSSNDYSIAGALFCHFGNLTGKVVPAEISYRYIDIGLEDAARRIKNLVVKDEKSRPDILCVNAVLHSEFSEKNYAAYKDAMETMFPLKCEFEK